MVDPNIWGKHGWKFIHYVAQGYPENPTTDDKKVYQNFFLNIGNILPCYKCSKNYKTHLQTNPLTELILNNKTNLENWVVSIHNQVNQLNQKNTISLEQARSIHIKDDCEIEETSPLQKNDIIVEQKTSEKELFSNKSEINYWIIIIVLVSFIFVLLIKKSS